MKVSVIIPAHNAAQYIRQTLDCIRTQNFSQSDIESIIFLDGCTDTTAEEIRQYTKDFPDMNLRVIEVKCQQGVSNARNSALRYAKGEYIHFYDADDIINTDFYKNLYDAAERTGSDVAVASYINERYIHNSISFEKEIVLSIPQDKIDATKVDKHGFSWRYLIKRSFWEHNKFGFPTDMEYCEDLLIMTKVIYHCNYLVLVPSAEYLYKWRKNSMLTTCSTKKIQNVYFKRARLETYMFLCQFDLKPTCDNVYKKTLFLFGIFPIYMSLHNEDNFSTIKYKLFGVFPILKLRKREKEKKWHI